MRRQITVSGLTSSGFRTSLIAVGAAVAGVLASTPAGAVSTPIPTPVRASVAAPAGVAGVAEAPAAVPPPTPGRVSTYSVTRAGVAYRTGPGTNYRQLGVLRAGGIVAGPGRTSRGWTQIYLSNGSSAWVLSSYLVRRAFPAYRVVARDGVNIRSGPGLRYRLLGALRFGVIVPGTRTAPGWIQLQLSTGGLVWATNRYLSIIVPPGTILAPQTGPTGPRDTPRPHPHPHGKVCRTTDPSGMAC